MEKKEIDILIVEDSPTDTELLMEKVRDFKVFNCQGRVKYVKKLIEAEKLLSEKGFDVVLLDLNLPDSRGIDSLKRIISIRKKAAVIIMTALSEQEIITEALNLGAQNYIVKGEESPVSLERAIMYSMEREKNIEEIKKSRKIQEEIIKNSPVMMFVLDENSRAISLNPETEKFSLKSSAEAAGMPAGEIISCINSYKDQKGCGHSGECGSCRLAASIRDVLSTGRSIRGMELNYTLLRGGRQTERVLTASLVKIPINGSFGILVSLEDITEIRRVEKEAVFFSEIQSAITQSLNLREIYRCLADRFNTLIGKAIIIVTATDETEKEVRVAAYSGLNEPVEKVIQFLGLDPAGQSYYIKDMTEKDLKQFRSGKLELIEGGVYALLTGRIPKAVCETAVKMLNVNYVYSIGLVNDGRHFGGVSFLVHEDIKQFSGLIECVMNYAASVIRRKHAEESLSASEEKYRQLYTSIGQGLALHEAIIDGGGNMTDYRFLEVNENFEKMTGMKMDNIIGRTVREVVPGVEPEWLKTYEEIVKTGKPGYIEAYSAPFKKYYAVYAYRPAPGRFATLVTDITARKNMEEELKISEEKFRAAFEQAAVGMTYTSLKGEFLEVNNRFCEIIGYSREEAEKLSFMDITHPDTLEKDLQAIKDLIDGRLIVYKTEKRYLKKDNTLVWVAMTASLMRNSDRTPKYFITVFEDISERKQAEVEALFFTDLQVSIAAADGPQDAYRIIADKVREFIGECITLITYLDERAGGFRTSAISGISEPVEKIQKLIKADFTSTLYRLKDINEDMLRPFRTGKLELFEQGIYSLAVGTIPKAVCDLVQKTINIKYVYTIGFVGDGRHFGSLNILTSNDLKKYAGVLERVTGYCAAVIKRKIAEKELKKSEEKWAAFNEAEKDILMIWDNELKLSAANSAAREACEAITGIKLSIGIAMSELAQKLGYPLDLGMLKSIIGTGKSIEVEEFGIPDGVGGEKFYSMNVIVMDSGIGLVVSDITQLKRSEIILKQSYEKLREVDRLKSNFISIISHELRTPLTIIKGFTSFLIKEAAGPLNDSQKNFVNTIDLNTARLARIINDMVDMSKIESGTFSIEKERYELAGVLNEAVDSMKHIAEEKGIYIEKEIDPERMPAEIDKGRIMQTITNLINNAMRFSSKNSAIRVGINSPVAGDIPAEISGKMKEEKNYYHLYVADEGAGIEKKYLEKIFERFYQVESANTRKHQGAGLGLSIAKSIVEAHGGFIWAESDGPGKGTNIRIILPE